MIIVESLIACALLYFAFQRKYISDKGIIIGLMLVIFVFSFFPSLSIPYIIDDVDHFHNMAAAIYSHQVILWLFTPHNEHIIPLIKAMYLFCYHYFGLDPELFHVSVLAMMVGVLVLVYKLILLMTDNSLAALIGASIMAATNITDDALFIGTDAQIFFCLFFLLLLFYAIYRYAQKQGIVWGATALGAVLLAPAVFSLGLMSIVLAVLFTYLCIPAEIRNNAKKLFPLLMGGWVLGLVPYILNMDKIIHADQYKYVHAHTIFQVAHVMAPLTFLSEYIASKLVPGVFTNAYLAFGLFFLCVFTVTAYFKEIAWKKISFFVFLGLSVNFIIYVFRIAWGANALDTPRYYTFPIVMVAFCYPLILDIFIKNTPRIKRVPMILAVYMACFFTVTDGCLWRYQNADMLLKRTMIMQNLYVNFRKAFVDYFQEHPDLVTLKVKDGGISLPGAPWPPSKPGMVIPIARYDSRDRSFYALFILPKSINDRIVWTDRTDPDFLAYLNANQYLFLSAENKK